MDKKRIKNIIIVAVIIAAAFVGYTFFAGNDYDNEVLSSSRAGDLTVVDELFSLLNIISKLRIDTSIFERESYSVLKDYTVTLDPQPQGRDNPFLPI